jgi:hypothetical protein
MKMLSHRLVLAVLVLLGGGIGSPSSARAHIDLIAPTARVSGKPDTTLGVRPCGERDEERAEDKVSVFRPGETIDVVWDVYVQHVSYFRIAFDADGDDSFSARASLPSDPASDDPTLLPAGDGETILAYVVDRDGDIDHVEQRVTLPNVSCERCTLQLIQFNYGLPIRDATYHQCADLVLEGLPVVASEAPEGDANDMAVAEDQRGCALRDAGVGQRRMAIAWLAVSLVAGWQRRRAARARRRPSLGGG